MGGSLTPAAVWRANESEEDPMPSDISETNSERDSEPVSKTRRRGRPPRYDPARLDQLRQDPHIHGRIGSTRGLQNLLYQERARQLLDRPEHAPWVRWLIDPEKIQRGERGGLRPTILAELGRLKDDRELVTLAKRLCEAQPRTHQAVQLIRRQRLWRPWMYTATERTERLTGQLTKQLLAVITRYREGYPEATTALILKALTHVRQVVRVEDALSR
jgi:hypothetical protein